MKSIRLFSFIILSTILSTAMAVDSAGISKPIEIISAGRATSFAIKIDGSLWAWGENTHGQLGDGTTINRHTPVWIMDDVVAVSAGFHSTMAIRSDNSLWGWGMNAHGEVGDGTAIDRHSPVKIMENVIDVSVGTFFTLAVQMDGSLWAWGWGYVGEDDEWAIHHSPVKIMDEVVAVSAGERHAAVIRADGSLWGWSDSPQNRFGQIGIGYNVFIEEPFPIKIMEDVVAVSSGADNTMAIRGDGSLWTWGRNATWFLGIHESHLHTPHKVMEDVVFVSLGQLQAFAITSDGGFWILGHMTSLLEHSRFAPPTRVMDDVIAVSAGGIGGGLEQHVLVVKSNGDLLAWGSHSQGRLGDGVIIQPFNIYLDPLPERSASLIDEITPRPSKILSNIMLPGSTVTYLPLPDRHLVAVLTVDMPIFVHNTERIVSDTTVFMYEDRVMVSSCIISSIFGATITQTPDTIVEIMQDENVLLSFHLDIPLAEGMGIPIYKDGNIFIPLRYLSEKLGFHVEFNEVTKSVRIYQ